MRRPHNNAPVVDLFAGMNQASRGRAPVRSVGYSPAAVIAHAAPAKRVVALAVMVLLAAALLI